jgi:hypothetical protein
MLKTDVNPAKNLTFGGLFHDLVCPPFIGDTASGPSFAPFAKGGHSGLSKRSGFSYAAESHPFAENAKGWAGRPFSRCVARCPTWWHTAAQTSTDR